MLRPGFFHANTVVLPTSRLHDEHLIERLAILNPPEIVTINGYPSVRTGWRIQVL